MLHLVGNLEDRVSHIAAQILKSSFPIDGHQFSLKQKNKTCALQEQKKRVNKFYLNDGM